MKRPGRRWLEAGYKIYACRSLVYPCWMDEIQRSLDFHLSTPYRIRIPSKIGSCTCNIEFRPRGCIWRSLLMSGMASPAPPTTFSEAELLLGPHKDKHFSQVKCLLCSTADKRPSVVISCFLCTFPLLEFDRPLCYSRGTGAGNSNLCGGRSSSARRSCVGSVQVRSLASESSVWRYSLKYLEHL